MRSLASKWLWKTLIVVVGWTVNASSALAANVCPFSGRRELAHFGNDLVEPVGEAVEATAGRAVWQRPAKHLEHMLSGEQRIDQPIEASSGSERCPRLRSKMPRFGTSQLEFPLQIGQGHVEIAHRHLGRSVTE